MIVWIGQDELYPDYRLYETDPAYPEFFTKVDIDPFLVQRVNTARKEYLTIQKLLEDLA